MDGLLAFGILLAMVALFGLPLLWWTERAARRHDPTLAEVASAVAPDGSFELSVPGGQAVYFRYVIDGDTDFDFDLVVRGTLTSGAHTQSFAHKTSRKSRLAGADAEHVQLTYSGSADAGSFVLAQLPEGEACELTGRVETDPPELLKQGWVYVPNDPRK